MYGPDKDITFPLQNFKRLCFLKNIIRNPNIIVGDYTYCGYVKNRQWSCQFQRC